MEMGLSGLVLIFLVPIVTFARKEDIALPRRNKETTTNIIIKKILEKLNQKHNGLPIDGKGQPEPNFRKTKDGRIFYYGTIVQNLRKNQRVDNVEHKAEDIQHYGNSFEGNDVNSTTVKELQPHLFKPSFRAVSSAASNVTTRHPDMYRAKGGRVQFLRTKGRLCQRQNLSPEGPKYDSKGTIYIVEHPTDQPNFENTSPQDLVLPKCCNCCQKSVLGCK